MEDHKSPPMPPQMKLSSPRRLAHVLKHIHSKEKGNECFVNHVRQYIDWNASC